MKYLIISTAVSALLLVPQAHASGNEELIKQSRAAVKALATELKATLQNAIKNDGKVNAISVCNAEAPRIASDISLEQGLNVSRTSLKVRNPSNKADSWEHYVLDQFEQRKSSGEAINKLEYSEITMKDGKRQFRYMKAIPTGDVCLACHGANISNDLVTRLDSLYPNDQARGYNKGDIRGAFSVTKPLD